jgi:hypothetical protein
MSKTFLQLVNNVLIRLREPEVATVNDNDYSKLVKIFINDAKREVEDSHNWNVLSNTIVLPTVDNVREYTLTGSGQRFKTEYVFNDTDDTAMRYVNNEWMSRQFYLSDTTQRAAPYYYNYNGTDNNNTKVQVWPIPDGVYSLRFELYVPQEDLSVDADLLKVPAHLVEMLAHAKAVAERGEDGGQTFAELYQMYRLSLADAISIEKNRYDDEVVWIET